MSTKLTRAKLTPYAADGTTPLSDQTIKLDFNPDTLTLKVSTAQQQDKARRGRQQVQNTGAASATLTFDAIFDTTRPKSHDLVVDGDRNDDTALDVRKRTGPIASWLGAIDPPKGSSDSGDGKPGKAPCRVEFQWGAIVFNGVITSHQETFDFFSPSGVPLRSKVQLTMTEQNFTYAVSAKRLAEAVATTPPSNVRDAATAAGANSLFDLGPGALSLGFSASGGVGISLDASASLSLQLGVSADFGVSLDAGFSMSASAALDVFGSAALTAGISASGGGGGSDVGQAGLSQLAPTPASPPGSTQPPSPWAPDGPAPGSAAAGLAASVNAMRAAGAAMPPPGGPGALPSTSPLPVRGSPPAALPRSPGILDTTVYSSTRLVPQAVLEGDRLPRWQALPGVTVSFAPVRPMVTSHPGGCGCCRCGGH
jgi:Contractile injection system tube protein